MKNGYDQLKIEFSETDKESNSVRLISIFLIIIFTLIPLAEIVTDFDYNQISYKTSTSFCVLNSVTSDNILSFKEIK